MSGMIGLEDRYASRIRVEEECWVWTGNRNARGYGLVWVGPRSSTNPQRLAHRQVFQILRRSLAPEETLHHACGNRMCVNPDHLEVMSRAEHQRLHPDNARRNWERLRAQTHCKRGHEFTSENTRMKPISGGYVVRMCRTCDRARRRKEASSLAS